MKGNHPDAMLAQQRLDATFQVKRIPDDKMSAVAILNDLNSAKAVADYYQEELAKRHKRFELEKQWPYLSQEEQKLIEHYQHYMENVKQQQDKIMRTVSLVQKSTEIDTADLDMARAPSVAQSAEQAEKNARRAAEKTTTPSQTICTVQMNDIPPKVVSYKEMSSTHSMEDNAALERIRKLVFEVKKNPKYGADIMRGFEKRCAGLARN